MAQTMHPILTQDGSNDTFWSQEMPFEVQNDNTLSSGSMEPQKLPFSAAVKIPAKTKWLNNILLLRNTSNVVK